MHPAAPIVCDALAVCRRDHITAVYGSGDAYRRLHLAEVFRLDVTPELALLFPGSFKFVIFGILVKLCTSLDPNVVQLATSPTTADTRNAYPLTKGVQEALPSRNYCKPRVQMV